MNISAAECNLRVVFLSRVRARFEFAANLGIVAGFALCSQKAHTRAGYFTKQSLRFVDMLIAGRKLLQIGHLPIGRRFNHLRVLFEQLNAQ